MSLHIERSNPASGRPVLVLLHGWGLHSGVWEPLLPALQQHFDTVLIDLPGLGRSEALLEPVTVQALAIAVLQQVPERAIWLGWSLGGLVAAEVARQAPERVCALVTVASNPCFVAHKDWPCGMAPETFDGFANSLASDPARTLASFALLQSRGAAAREILRRLKVLLAGQAPADLAGTLQLLAQDGRATLAALSQPALHILGGEDQLVPATLAEPLQRLQPGAWLRCYEDAGHLPFYSHQARFVEDLVAFAGAAS
ncbi:pimeloyl-ACP methyl ester esterase BioH [Marinobacterium rhizophilum]|uniref:Pimeloyl-[acyl-carrier protein] methyl ester esterase n=1 Tax=Marinobacterium rhizophilum TaxID=420402 RepID=A0ABY5HP29_9GAMM|nr:pimeloyl-ACP methyl ester esterase BioH [Marinobacterium rhizophilum]UTW14188.1 pimeloyl-ACP methyl ester esterase BioH [Marinobacterium rhizophilum]